MLRCFPIALFLLIFSLNASAQVKDSLSKIPDEVYSDDQQWRNRMSYYRDTYGYHSVEMRVVMDSMRLVDREDRVAVRQGLDQVYGSQIAWDMISNTLCPGILINTKKTCPHYAIR